MLKEHCRSHATKYLDRIGMVLCIIFLVALAIAFLLPLFSTAHARMSRCEHNLMVISNEEWNWAGTYQKPTNAIPTWDDLRPFLKDHAAAEGWRNDMPTCPQGGKYILTPVREHPRCSIGGRDHSIPQAPRLHKH